MKSIRIRLNNSQGVSMIIAMVFMLICIFVGATVLTASTVNTFRIDDDTSKQAYLDQRSAAMLIADDLRTGTIDSLRLIIHNDNIVTEKIVVGKNGIIDESKTVVTGRNNYIRFEVIVPGTNPMTSLQRTVFETAILNYLRSQGIVPNSPGTVIQLENFPDVTNYDNFWLKPSDPGFWDPTKSLRAEGAVKLTNADGSIDFIANFHGEADPNYNYVADFPGGSQLEVRLFASEGHVTNDSVEEIFDTQKERKITTTKLKVISWSEPQIVKKGAA